ncbi:hypothetical protein IMG5_122540 [Ichthyophthirius multifiliis]|uniref:G domain-containing protein n=1 Tax=Ichthyophthirius multifiliis TaxID=5932 RepID=G0QVA9_ICHMU|nr:hypothetical protein IMG5_122540 [Ichthyophthirius multifiliis]EGR30853.1 hypothetical protein IMG5_122540 [Ichthyophthirius multifiliis]|eukprot:XP_004032440.1 hypothetical protein IMG5_122540 [Ichthyophthirius multifiliis]
MGKNIQNSNKKKFAAKKNVITKNDKDQQRKNKRHENLQKALGCSTKSNNNKKKNQQKRKKGSKNIELPNLNAFKRKIQQSLERKKNQKNQLNQLKNNENKYQNIQIQQIQQNHENIQEEEKFQKQFEYQDDQDFQYQQLQQNDNNILIKDGKKYFREMKKVLEASDIILEVLDARDPESSRCRQVEAELLQMKGNKRIILVGNAEAWLKVLRREYATVLFKGNTQNQNDNLSGNQLFKKSLTNREDLTNDLMNSSKSVGADKLLELIKNYSKNDGIKTAVSVGVIGYPNVGKSSLINSLKRSKACGVSSVAGYTKNLQEVIIDKKVKVIDCPGVIFDDENKKNCSLKNVIKPELIEDPIQPVEEILQKITKNEILLLYKIDDFKTTLEFLCKLAILRGKIKKGGAPNIDIVARMVIQDWNSGKIKYYTIPPVYEVEQTIVLNNQLNIINEQIEQEEIQ